MHVCSSADKPIEQIGLAEIARACGVSLSELRGGQFGSTLASWPPLKRPTARARRHLRRHGRGAPARSACSTWLNATAGVLAPYKAAGAFAAALDPCAIPPLAFALNDFPSAPHNGADRRRLMPGRPRGNGARAGARRPVRHRAAHLGADDDPGPRPRPHHGYPRPRAFAAARAALVGSRWSQPHSDPQCVAARGGAAASAADDEERSPLRNRTVPSRANPPSG